MGLLDTDYAAVNAAKPRKSNRILPGEPLNVRGLLDAATNIPVAGDALSGGLAVYDAIKGDYPSAAMNAVSILPGVSAGMVGMFAGKGAKTFDALKAAKAEKMIADGVDRAKAWQETGYGYAPWQKPGTDAAIRHEISDHAATVQPDGVLHRAIDKEAVSNGAPTSFPQWVYMDHKPLYDSYEGAKRITIRPTEDWTGGGSYNNAGVINISAFADNPKSVNLHELQHAIQQREGWARGGSNVPSREMEQSLNSDLQNLLMQNPKAESVYNDWSKIYNDIEAGREFDPVKYESLEEQLSSLKGGGEIMDRHHSLSGLADSSSAQSVANDYYKRLAGEAEARLTQYRMNLSPEERLAQYPYDPEYFKKATGVDIDKLIVRGLLGE